MSGLKLFTSNRLEVLVDLLADMLREPLTSPLAKEVVVVQSKGMERWVSMQLARHQGICANFRFPFPNALVDEVFSMVLGEVLDPSPFHPPIMTWRIMRLLPACIARPGFESLRSYLSDDSAQLKQFQLSQRIADLFDQYLVFRPDMMLAWEDVSTNERDWQPLLWKSLVKETRSLHRAALRARFFGTLNQITTLPRELPERLTIFGISALPPFHMSIFHALSDFIPVNLFLLNPCGEYWADIRSERETNRIVRRQGGKSLTAESLHLESGNSLLASLGTLGRDFHHLIQDLAGETHELFREPGERSLLGCIQTDILHLKERNSKDKSLVDAHDRSIAIHSCHSPMREMEVLHDQLLALFEENPKIGPKDVLVMTPDIDVYAPFIHAVFDAPEHPALKIPFSVTDRSLRKESRIIQTFLEILELVGGRLAASRVLGLLESSSVRRRFKLSENQVALIHSWVANTRIRWGMDAPVRVTMGFGDFAENTWRAGLERLLLGYALPGEGECLFRGILPYDDIEGSEAVVLGGFVEFTERLFADLAVLAHPRILAEWEETLARLLDRFFEPDAGDEKEVQALRQALNQLGVKQGAAGFEDPVSLEVVRSLLGHRLETETAKLGFITGGITFCAMLPMRSIPFQVICLVGMNDEAFPRQSKPLGFDLMAKAPQLGDRSQRNDDRYLFLEALLSARRRFYISYVGQSLEDNSTLPPSVLVSELLDVIERGFIVSGTDDILDHLSVHHPLQAFSRRYFRGDDPKFFSYSSENCQAIRDSQGELPQSRLFVASPIGEPEEEWRDVDVAQLEAFFAHPVKFFLQRRLQIKLEVGDTAVVDRENFELDHLEQYLLAQQLLDRKLSGIDPRSLFPVVKASGGLPHGTVGRCQYDMLAGKVESFFASIEPFLRAPPLPPQDVEVQLGGFHLTGHIDRIRDLGLVQFRSARIKATDHLKLWLRHLTLNTCAVPNRADPGFLIGKDAAFRYGPVENASQILMSLLDAYWEGLRRPLHFFPQTSLKYAETRMAGKSREQALKEARREWEPVRHENYRSEGQDAYLQLCFGRTDPLDEEFERLALEIFEPVLNHQNAVK